MPSVDPSAPEPIPTNQTGGYVTPEPVPGPGYWPAPPGAAPAYGPAHDGGPWQNAAPYVRQPLVGAAKAAVALAVAYVVLGWVSSLLTRLAVRWLLSSGGASAYTAFSYLSMAAISVVAICGLAFGIVAMRTPGSSRTAGALAVGACGAGLAGMLVSTIINAAGAALY